MRKLERGSTSQPGRPTMWHPDLFTAWALSVNADLKTVRMAREAYQRRQDLLRNSMPQDRSVIEKAKKMGEGYADLSD